MSTHQKTKTLTKLEIAEQLAQDLSLQLGHAREFVDDFFGELREILASSHPVHLSGFGNFDLRDKKARPGCNPKTGEKVTVAPRRVVTFKLGAKLRQRV